MSLASLGFDSLHRASFQSFASAGAQPGRVASQHRDRYELFTARGVRSAELAGRLHHELAEDERPAVGDWVAFREDERDASRAIVAGVLPRKTVFRRGEAGGVTRAQVVAANVDVLFLVLAKDDLNARRLERALVLARASGARPVLVLTKWDLEFGDEAFDAEAFARAASGAPVHRVSCVTGEGVVDLHAYFDRGATVALLGASGAGKSTLVNRLAGFNAQTTGPMGVDGRGTHTTTRRDLVPLASGGCILDTPGMRELRLWASAEDVDDAFEDVAAIASRCRFRDCTHSSEPGCAIEIARGDGTLSIARWRSYDKLRREAAALERRKDARAIGDHKRRMKSLSRDVRARLRSKGE